MNSISQICHTEYEPNAGIGDGSDTAEVSVARMFKDVPSIEQLSPDRRMPAARLILTSQENAANQRRGFYYKYIRALADVGFGTALIHHGGSNSRAYIPDDIPAEALTIFSRAVFLAGDKLNVHELYNETRGASAEHGHVTQFGDWNIDTDLKVAIEALPQNRDIAKMGITFEKIHRILNPPEVRYKAKITDNPEIASDYPAITVSRLRPVADLSLTSLSGARHRLELVKRADFAVIGDHAEKESKKRVDAFIGEEDHKGINATALGQSVVEQAIADYRAGELSVDTFPAESVYFAILRKKK
ncbi:MAG: hypothetical protein ABIQ64_03165 [Candidatus Saccharimonadales bacterium]